MTIEQRKTITVGSKYSTRTTVARAELTCRGELHLSRRQVAAIERRLRLATGDHIVATVDGATAHPIDCGSSFLLRMAR